MQKKPMPAWDHGQPHRGSILYLRTSVVSWVSWTQIWALRMPWGHRESQVHYSSLVWYRVREGRSSWTRCQMESHRDSEWFSTPPKQRLSQQKGATMSWSNWEIINHNFIKERSPMVKNWIKPPKHWST